MNIFRRMCEWWRRHTSQDKYILRDSRVTYADRWFYQDQLKKPAKYRRQS